MKCQGSKYSNLSLIYEIPEEVTGKTTVGDASGVCWTQVYTY